MTSPLKNNGTLNKRKAGTQQVYRKIQVDVQQPPQGNELAIVPGKGGRVRENGFVEELSEDRECKKKKPTPTNSENSAAAGLQPCQSQ